MATIVVIGGVAAGMSAASQAKRRSPKSNVVVLERGQHVSYGACGIPYNIEDPAREIEDLVVVSAERFRTERGIDLRTNHEAVSIDSGRKTIAVKNLESGSSYDLGYDALVIATGATPVKPNLPGIDCEGVFLLRTLADGAKLKATIAERNPKKALIVGAGYIGMEVAEALSGRGIEVTIIEMRDRVLPAFDAEVSARVAKELAQKGVLVRCGCAVSCIRSEPSGRLAVQTTSGEVETDLIVVAIGVRANVQIAKEAGVVLGETGAIAVDSFQRTNLPDVYAAGDCAEAYHNVLKRPAFVPLGTTSNKQGKVAGANAIGDREEFKGILGTAGFKVFDLEVARTGLDEQEARSAGFEPIRSVSTHSNRGHGYPGAGQITTVLFVDRNTERIVGAQMLGAPPVAMRVNVFATAIQAQMTVSSVEELDLAYAPPFAPVYDPVLIAAGVAKKSLSKAAVDVAAAGSAPRSQKGSVVA